MSKRSAPEPAQASGPNRNHLTRLRIGGVIAQHAKGREPDPHHGVCTDDVARLLEVDLLHGAALGWSVVDESVGASLEFLAAAFVPHTGRFRNVRSVEGRWLHGESEDAQGRAIASLGKAAAAAGRSTHRALAERLFRRALPSTELLGSIRAMASVVLGCDAVAGTGAWTVARDTERDLLARLTSRFAPVAGTAWPWPESKVTYEAALPAQALIRGGLRLDDSVALSVGLNVLDWLMRNALKDDGTISFVGNKGWWARDGARATFDQQPIEASSTFLAAEAAMDATSDPGYADIMERAYAWFLGANVLGVAVAEPENGACHDGLTPTGVNVNEGAESTLAWLLVAERTRVRRMTSAGMGSEPRAVSVGAASGSSGRSQ